MRRIGRWEVFGVDLIGGLVVAAGVCGALWLLVLRENRAPAILRDLNLSARTTEDDIQRARAALHEQQRLLAERKARLESHGRLPDHAPIEEYFQTLSRLAARFRLQVRGQSPLPSRSYPGLLEQRYAFEVAGMWPDLARFLKAIEDADFWADVSYFKIESTRGPAGADSNERVALLTISLFSAHSEPEPLTVGKG